MNIAYVHSGFWPSNSPSITFVTYNAVGLSQVFNHCDLYVKKNFENTSGQVFEEQFALQQPSNLQIRYPARRPVINSNHLYFRGVASQIVRSAKSMELHGVITRTPTFLPFLVRLKKRLNIPVFYETHDFFSDLSIRSDLTNKNRFKQLHLEKKYIPQIDGLFCLQETQIECYRKVFPGQHYHLLRTGIHRIFRHPVEKRKFIAYIGSLDFHKGIEVLLNALQRSKTKPHFLVIGGKTEKEINALEKEVEALYDPERVTITGWVNKENLHRYLAETALGIIPLRSTFFNTYLTSPLKLFDYYSFGIPVIASDLPTTRALIEEHKTGYFFRNDDPADLAQKIDLLMNDSKRLSEMNAAVYTHAEQYLWHYRAEKIRQIIEDHHNTGND